MRGEGDGEGKRRSEERELEKLQAMVELWKNILFPGPTIRRSLTGQTLREEHEERIVDSNFDISSLCSKRALGLPRTDSGN